MDGIVAQMVRNLGKIHFPVPDQPFCGIHSHQGKIVNDSVASIIPENLLQKGASDQIVPAYLGNG
jgi:hypothetical protein